MLLSGDQPSDHTSSAQMSPITMITNKTRTKVVMTPTTTPATAVMSTPPNASGVVPMLPLSRTRETAVHATLSLLLKSLSPTLPLMETVFTTYLSNKLLTVDMVTTVVATVDGPHLFCAKPSIPQLLSCLLKTTSTKLLRAAARSTQRTPPSKSRLMVLLV